MKVDAVSTSDEPWCRYKKDNQLFVAAEGMYSGQFVYCGKNGETFLWRGTTLL